MYATCLHCQRNLGTNDRIEHFQTGRKLAFDGARGRLWVVCPACSHWNLTPLEERWEAIEECEKLFRSTPRRASTSEIALATVPESIDLVRVGRPLRPEFAAWRYGERLIRRRRFMRWAGPGVGAVGFAGITGIAATLAASPSLVISMIPMILGPPALAIAVATGAGPLLAGKKNWRRILHTAGVDLTPFQAMQSGTEIALARAANPDGWRLKLTVPGQEVDLQGTRAYHVLGLLLPRLSIWGASSAQVDRAVTLLDDARDPVKHISKTVDRICRSGYAMSDIATIPLEMRLSLEMASQEEAERRALEGELAELEASWRRAEEVAAIADDLLLPKSIGDFIERHRPKRES